jgi:hypothetical protein
MLYMKEDDMDEMLRKAAENYEVDADKVADWNAINAAVHITGETEPAAGKKRKRRFVFWWLLLIPLGWIANTEYNKFHTAYTNSNNNSSVSVQPKTKEAKQPSPENILPANSINNKNTTTYSNAGDHVNELHMPVITNEKVSSNNNLNAYHPSFQEQPVKTLPQNQLSGFNNAGRTEINKTPVAPGVDPQKNNSPELNNNATATQNANAKTAASSTKKQSNNGHYFYAGLIAGADFSFVKFQDMQPLGYNFGLLVGYKFNKLSIESGLYVAKKNYYTDGEYFDKSKIPYFNNADILSVDGYCNMFEIPLNVKYDISQKKKHTWFATAGLSSYLMHKEFYNYDYIKDGQEHHGSKPYYNTTQNWFSILNLSAGYQLQTGAKTNLRIEPYYKTALTGVGTGSLSISSAGINIGVVRRIP